MNELLAEIEQLKAELDKFRSLDNDSIRDALAIEYTYESNRIEGNTLTLRETDLVINKGLTIGGKSMREHLEAINHKDAIDYIKEIAQSHIDLSERVIKDIHALILRGIDKENAGTYRKLPVMISGASHIPPQPYLLEKLMEEYFEFYEASKYTLHPVILAAEMHERLVSIHPFIDGNGRTSRLVMNLLLVRNGYPITNIKGDTQSRLQYYEALETVQMEENKNSFIEFIAVEVKKSLEHYLKLLR
ncbi:Fic family protein [Emticicia agri]|uniref:Fic family protein n=1 Tax=Emticicia agri TaxID=2492393 RepID=A0A4Q5LTY6_9BACT|nr:Fic family protein [Emticicia agri]RYU93108.1 Fic family protein [Emticicia agri]